MRGLEAFNAANWRGQGWRPAAVALALAAALVALTTAAPVAVAPDAGERPSGALAASALGHPLRRTPAWTRAMAAHRCGAADHADRRRLIVTTEVAGGRRRLVTIGAACAGPVPEAARRYCRLAEAPARARRQAQTIQAHNLELARTGALPGCRPAPGSAPLLEWGDQGP